MDQRKPRKYFDFSVAEAAAALRWWSQAGVESVVDEVPRNHFIGESPAPFTPEHALPGRTPVETPVSASAGRGAVEAQRPPPDLAAKDLAASAPDLATLKSILESFEGCGLKRTATQLVFADGTPGSRVMFVGEAPGGDEDRIGRPFVGRAGQLLDRMLMSIGLDRGQIYIANVVPWRPPGNRTPTVQENLACLPFIKRQIELAQPEILVCLGASAAQALIGLRQGITRARGTWSEYHCENGRTLRSLAMLHPAYLLRQPGQKRHAWTDMRALAKGLAI